MPHLGEQTFLSFDYKESTVSGAGAKGARINAPHAPEDALACSSLPSLNCGQDKCTDMDRPTDTPFVTAAFAAMEPRDCTCQNAE